MLLSWVRFIGTTDLQPLYTFVDRLTMVRACFRINRSPCSRLASPLLHIVLFILILYRTCSLSPPPCTSPASHHGSSPHPINTVPACAVLARSPNLFWWGTCARAHTHAHINTPRNRNVVVTGSTHSPRPNQQDTLYGSCHR